VEIACVKHAHVHISAGVENIDRQYIVVFT